MSDLVKYQDDRGGEVTLSPGIVKKYLVSGKPELVTDAEFLLYIKLCQEKKLNPFNKDSYLIKYSPKSPAAFVTSVDVFKRRMETHPMMDGMKLGVVLMREGNPEPEYREDAIVPPDATLIGAWMEVKRKDWSLPVRCAVNISEYEQWHKDYDTNKMVLNHNWETMRATMITKCVIGCAGRLAFPSDFQGLYTAEELARDEEPPPTPSITPVKAGKPIEAPVTQEEGVEAVQEVFEGGEIIEETLPEVETIKNVDGKIIIEDGGEQEAITITSTSNSPLPGEDPSVSPPPHTIDDEGEPEEPQDSDQQKANKERRIKALFASMSDYAKAIKANDPTKKGSIRNEVEEEIRDTMSITYGKFSIKSLNIEELDEMREWVTSKTTALNEG